jgi:rare lipoprotein A
MAVLLALPAQASTPATGAMGAEFTASFEDFEELPVPAEPAPEAVDLDSFEPPVEAEPATRSLGTGVASYYAAKFQGRRTASGEAFDNGALTAAHRTLPFGTLVRVTNVRTGQSVIVRINDRGPFTKGRTIDLSRAAAEQIGIVRAGHGTVELEVIES